MAWPSGAQRTFGQAMAAPRDYVWRALAAGSFLLALALKEGTMALKFEDVAKPETLLVSAALALTWRFVFPVMGTILRPAAKAAIKGGLYAADWGLGAI